MQLLYPALLLVMSLVCFALMGIDKRRAIKGQWRISEKALFLSALFLGAVGGVIAMKLFRHKTKHWYFQLGFPVLAIIQVIIAVYFLSI